MKINLNYPQLAAEFVIVFVGVAVALAADSWREDFSNSGEERRYIERIRADVELGMSQISPIRDRFQKVIDSSIFLIDSLETDNNATAESLVLSLLQAGQTGQVNFSHDNAYRELISSGRLNLIQDEGLRDAIGRYYRSVEDIIAYSATIPEELTLKIIDRTGWWPGAFLDNSRFLTEQDRIRLQELLRTDTELIQHLRRNLSRSRGFLNRMDRSIALNTELSEQIR